MKYLLILSLLYLSNNDNLLAQSIEKIAFGSCSHQNKQQPILYEIAKLKPDLFIYLGDNIYGDTRNMKILEKKYKRLGRKKEFKNLKKNTQLLATWDDHDYGENDAGKYYPFKDESKQLFLNFWGEPDSSSRRKHKGIYHSLLLGSGDSIIQIILLDTRTFRDNLLHTKKGLGFKNDYMPNEIKDSTILGIEQWKWLEKEFQKPAKIRILATSTQFGHEYNGWESWTNVPHERKKMLDLIKETNTKGILFISGDVHWGEISKLNTEGLYPIYDITSSGLTQTWDAPEPNKNRIGEVVMENNFGFIEINWEEPISLKFQIIDYNNTIRIEKRILLSEILYN